MSYCTGWYSVQQKKEKRMKKIGRIIRSSLCALGLFLSPTALQAVETWVGATTFNVNLPDTGETSLVLDASGGDIIVNNSDLCNSTSINAITSDVTVTLTGDVTMTGNLIAQTILRLNAAAGHTITFDLTSFSLTLKGSTDFPVFSPLLILCEGQGRIIFQLRGGQSLTLTNDNTHGPVELYRILGVRDDLNPSLSFVRSNATNIDEGLEAYVNIGPRCLISFASLDGLINESYGTMIFDPTNTEVGRFVVAIEDTGALTLAVHQATLNQQANDICLVNRNIPAGGFAETYIFNNGSATDDAALMINNYNKTYAEYLIDPYGNQNATSDSTNYSGSFNGLRYGFTIGANHSLFIEPNAYLDYVGLANNTCPTPDSLPCIVNTNLPLECPCDPGIQQYLKTRNYSAFTVDGWYNPNAVPSQIFLFPQSGIYFRSGVNANGEYNDDFGDNVFTIDPTLMTAGAGEYVFDVEAPLKVFGSNGSTTTLNSRLEILSLQVAPLAGPLFPVEGDPLNRQFLARTFEINPNDEQYFQYNKAAWLINDRIDLDLTALAHTDELHLVCQNNDVISEPTYVGGEKWWLSFLRFGIGDNECGWNYCIQPPCPLVSRPSINFVNGLLQVQTSLAATGVDFAVPTFIALNTSTVSPNESEFRFYSNGYLVDQGTGRSMILGTLIGSQACDGCTIISDDAHLNVIQDQDYSIIAFAPIQLLNLTDSQNNNLVNPLITTDITDQTSIEAIYLGHNSNISIGENAPTSGFVNDTLLALNINGNFFHFGTRGGSVGIPATSNVTGQGGIFVDLNGTFSIAADAIATFDVMVTKSQNGEVLLPPAQVFFSDTVGIAQWQPNMTINNVIVPIDTYYSDYTLDWLAITKDPAFFPYLISDVNICDCPPFTTTNMTQIPEVQGQVDQLQIVGSRIGDPVHLYINGGWVRELVFLPDCKAGEAPVAVVVMRENGRLGLNNAHRNPDSVWTQTVLGANGINIVADGNGRIDLNDDVIINNICSIIPGPDFAPGNVLEFLADTPYTLRVTKDGILDLSAFTVAGTIRFGGNIRVNFEPGAQVILGAATLEFSDNAVVEVESAYQLQANIAALDSSFGPINNNIDPLVSVVYTAANNEYSPLTGYGFGLLNTDAYRVRVMGTGTMRFTDDSSMLINTNGIFSVESLYVLPSGIICSMPATQVTLEVLEAAQINIGNGNNILGGVFQVGNVQSPDAETAVNFVLTLNGADARFNIGAGGFFGLGAGVVRPNQGTGDNQSNVLADTLFNTDVVILNLLAGEFNHNRIFNSDNEKSSSMVLGSVGTITVNFENVNNLEELNAEDFLISGGGNFFLLVPAGLNDVGAMRLINRFENNIINAPFGATTVPLVRMRSSILASTELLDEDTDPSGTPLSVFLSIKTGDATAEFGPATGFSDAAALNPDRFRQEREFGLLGYVDRNQIGRESFMDVVDSEGGTQGERRARLYDLGAARVQIDTSVAAPGPVTLVSQVRT